MNVVLVGRVGRKNATSLCSLILSLILNKIQK